MLLAHMHSAFILHAPSSGKRSKITHLKYLALDFAIFFTISNCVIPLLILSKYEQEKKNKMR